MSHCQPCYEAVICLSMPTNPGQSACGGNVHPLGCSGRGVHAEMLQTLGCHLAVMVVCVVLSLDAWRFESSSKKRLSSLEVIELEINRRILYHIIHFASETCKKWQTPVSFQMQSCSNVIHQFALTWETLHLALKLSTIGHMKIHHLRNLPKLDCTFVVKGTKPNVFIVMAVFITGALLTIRGMTMRDGIRLVHFFFDAKGWIMFIL